MDELRVNRPTTATKEYLLVIRREAVDAAAHWLGNLLQRLRAIEQALHESESTLAGPMNKTLLELDQLLRLLLDYLSEAPMRFELLPASEFLDSLVAALARQYTVQIQAPNPEISGVGLRVDPFAVNTALGYLPLLLHADGAVMGTEVRLETRLEASKLCVSLCAGPCHPRGTAALELCHAVVEKLMVSQGGEFGWCEETEGSKTWILSFPV
jgi:hypothetical protein